MCLSVYLGTTRPITIPDAARGHLGAEKAAWTPPPLGRGHPFVYYVGAKGSGAELECSCLLMEHVDWTETGPVVHDNSLYPEGKPCPFEVLRALCDEASREGGWATIVCDDSGGLALDCSEDDYHTGGLIRLDMIARGNLLFADASGGTPWRVLHVVR